MASVLNKLGGLPSVVLREVGTAAARAEAAAARVRSENFILIELVELIELDKIVE
jgi:hypothetical protein